MRPVFVCTLAALLQVSLISAAEPVETPARWDGRVQDRALQKLAPESGVIADAKSWKTLWETWRSGEKLPPIEFQKDIVVVGVVSGPNRVLLRPTLAENGDLRFIVAGTRMAGPGFGYALVKVLNRGNPATVEMIVRAVGR